MAASVKRTMTIEDFLAIPEEQRFHELIGGELIEKTAPSGAHGSAQAGIVITLGPPFQRAAGRGGPGGWWFETEVELLLGAEIVRPDIAGRRRERCPERPTEPIVKVRPDWLCEVLSPTNASNDTVKKQRLYHHHAIQHYWIVDPQQASRTVMRWSDAGYINVLVAERGETVRAEPFAEIEIDVGTLFGEDPT
jgi:Uma2 family endonuclease